MQVKIVGIKHLDFKSATGDEIKGNSLYVCFDEEGVLGMRTEKFFLKENVQLPKDLKLNEVIELSFNHKGKIEAVSKVSK